MPSSLYSIGLMPSITRISLTMRGALDSKTRCEYCKGRFGLEMVLPESLDDMAASSLAPAIPTEIHPIHRIMPELIDDADQFVFIFNFLCPFEIRITQPHEPNPVLVTDTYVILPRHALQGGERAGRHAEGHQPLRYGRVLRDADIRNASLLGQKAQDIA